MTGSSAAAAVVAGAAALVLEATPDLTPAALEGALVGTAQPLSHEGVLQPTNGEGAGLVDPRAAAATLATVERSRSRWAV